MIGSPGGFDPRRGVLALRERERWRREFSLTTRGVWRGHGRLLKWLWAGFWRWWLPTCPGSLNFLKESEATIHI
eukprot:jgi/Tetstr1/425872/TSEL_016247.t1